MAWLASLHRRRNAPRSRCGVGVAHLRTDCTVEHAFCFGLYCPLPGVEQSVPRAELYGILIVVKHAVPSAVLDIRSDSKVNVDMFTTGRENTLHSTSADLWQELWSLIDHKSLSVSLTWIKGHCTTPEQATKHGLSLLDVYGNATADRLADRAATLYEVAPQDALDLNWYHSVTRKIQARAVIILSNVIPERGNAPPAPPRVPRPPTTTLGEALFSTKHRFAVVGPSMKCINCFEVAPRMHSHLIDWLGSECRPDSALKYAYFSGSRRPSALPRHRPVSVGRRYAHCTHDLFCYQGLVFCKTCGYYASKRMLRLAEPCTGASLEALKRSRSLFRGQLPSGVPDWPSRDSMRELTSL